MRIAPEIKSAAAKAADTVPSHSSPAIENPDVMASAAPNEAPDVMPRVVGLAKGFAVIVWIRSPASDKAAPTVTAVRAAGSRISRTMKAVGGADGDVGQKKSEGEAAHDGGYGCSNPGAATVMLMTGHEIYKG